MTLAMPKTLALLKRLGAGALLALLVLGTQAAHAVPTLQLDIFGGTYDPITETIVTDSDTFTVYAYATPGNVSEAEILAETYYLSIALTPATSQPADLGSFVVDSTTVHVTDDMLFGTPPFEANMAFDAQDLAKHGIFPTYFTELQFTFDGNDVSGIYNTQDDSGSGPKAGMGMLFAAFEFDKSDLSNDVELHMDLYNTKVRSNGDIDRDDFAPFSHDAGTAPVPEPSAALLFGLGGLAVGRRLRR